jgi:tetratricopeptide (TPR) repeat protein
MRIWSALILAFLCAPVAARAEVDAGAIVPDGDAENPKTSIDRDGAQRLSKKALAHIKDGAWEEATDLFRRAHEKDARNAAIATDYGYALAHLGHRDEAERLYRLAVALDPNRFYAYVNLAELWVSDPTRWQRSGEMVAFLEKGLLAVGPDLRASAHVELRLAELLRSLGRTADARVRLDHLTGAAIPTQVRQRAVQLVKEMDAEGGERALDDWPPPAVSADDRARLDQARVAADTRGALATLDALVARWPAWAEARWERARLLERQGQFDEATTDLAIVVQLVPSHARAWRRLGVILAVHGGRFEAGRADEALRHALALEPSWSDLRELRSQALAKRARSGRKPAGERASEPTEKARQLFQDAQSWIGMEAPEMAPPLLRQALGESPAFVEAAAALHAIEHVVPGPTVQALWNDGAQLWQLALQVGALRSREAATLARPWIDRAVELDHQEARFARASLRAAAGDRAGALADLRDYVASEPRPPRLEEARALRLTLDERKSAESPERMVHLRLAADRPADALAALGGACRKGLPLSSLLALGQVHEFGGHVGPALDCYQQAIEGAGNATPEQLHRAWERLAAAATSLPPVELTRFGPSLEAAAKANVGLAAFSLARMAEARRQWPEAEAQVRTFLAQAADDDPRTAEARALVARVRKVVEHEIEEEDQRRDRIRVLAALLVVAGLALLILRRRYRQPIGRALRAHPLLFPALAKAVGQVRHDVLKHRGSALELLSDASTDRQDVARALLEPTPASAEVTGIYRHLSEEARGLGVRLRPLEREPVFGPLVRDLARAEDLLGRPTSGPIPDLYKIDERLRGEHADRLQTLLRLGPRTVLDAGLVARWIDGIAAEPGRAAWIAPKVTVPDTGATFPLPEATLCSLFCNLLRNAVAASGSAPQPAVEVRADQGRDHTGRRMVSLLFADSSAERLDPEMIEKRPADRGLGIVRETTRTWGGEIVVREEAAPFCKAVGVRFPAPPEEKR